MRSGAAGINDRAQHGQVEGRMKWHNADRLVGRHTYTHRQAGNLVDLFQ